MYLTHRHGGNFISRLTLRIMCFDSKPGCGTPALFAGISNLYGIKKNGYTGLTTDMLFSNSSAWEDLLPGHKTTLDTMYTMTIPYKALGVTKKYVKNNGIGIMHVSTYGASGITSIPAEVEEGDTVLLSVDAVDENGKSDTLKYTFEVNDGTVLAKDSKDSEAAWESF